MKKLPQFLAVLVAALTFWPATPSRADETASKPTSKPPAQPLSPAQRTAQLVDEVLRETSEIRELSILRPVKSGVSDRAAVEKVMKKELDEENARQQVAVTELLLKKLGLVPENFNLARLYTSVMGEQIAGYYDPHNGTFYLAKKADASMEKTIMAHELTHALQDQHFNLSRFDNYSPDNSDAHLAMKALVEGDATLTMRRYLSHDPARWLGAIGASFAAGFNQGLSGESRSKEFLSGPRVLRESLTFPYLQGASWAAAVQRRGGWKAVSDAFSDLPRSTEQILHPEKYFDHEAPITISLRDSSRRLGKGWNLVDTDVDGEFGIYQVLDEFLKDPAASKRAAAGWGGDRYALYQGQKPGEVLLVQLVAWDNENEAREFFEAYAKRTILRYRTENLRSIGSTATRRAWHAASGGILMERKGNRVLVAEGVPSRFSGSNLMQGLWQDAARG